ncbi:hypothetical protein J6590_033183 [Homalodisca vitripennis]|nr:hypothetical protein J6590_033183 [Homalodisca vitripennis]
MEPLVERLVEANSKETKRIRKMIFKTFPTREIQRCYRSAALRARCLSLEKGSSRLVPDQGYKVDNQIILDLSCTIGCMGTCIVMQHF